LQKIDDMTRLNCKMHTKEEMVKATQVRAFFRLAESRINNMSSVIQQDEGRWNSHQHHFMPVFTNFATQDD
ncbi:hypothetical protein PENTCL1PPCAC_12279, partial [Pristionchus entomophagus]